MTGQRGRAFVLRPGEGRDVDMGNFRMSLKAAGEDTADVYAGTTEQFRADARMHRIAEKLRAEYTTQIGHRPAPSEVASWQNSLMALSMLVDQAELNDHGVILEYQLGNTSRRLDAMLTGHSPTSAENAVVVELKQPEW